MNRMTSSREAVQCCELGILRVLQKVTVKLIEGDVSYKFSKITILTSNMAIILTWHFMTYHLPVP